MKQFTKAEKLKLLSKIYRDMIIDPEHLYQKADVDFYLTGGTAPSRCYQKKSIRISLGKIFQEAREKDLWVEPIEICKIIDTFPVNMLSRVKWIQQPDFNKLAVSLKTLHDEIFYGLENSFFPAQ